MKLLVINTKKKRQNIIRIKLGQKGNKKASEGVRLSRKNNTNSIKNFHIFWKIFYDL